MIRAGIVGAGLMGRWHAAYVRRAGGRVAAVMDTDREAGEALARRYRARYFGELGEMLGDAELELVHICTPLESHAHYAQMAIEAGLHVLVEKPMTPTAEEAEVLYALASERGVILCPVHQFLFQDGVLKAQRWLAQTGRILHMDAKFHSAGGEGQVASRLGDIVFDILPHPLSLFVMLMNDTIEKGSWSAKWPEPGELQVLGEASGASITLAISMSARPTISSFSIFGSRGTIQLDLFHGYAFRESGRVSRGQKILRPWEVGSRQLSAATLNIAKRALTGELAYPGLQRLIARFYQTVQTGGSPPIPAKDAVLAAKMRQRLRANALQDYESRTAHRENAASR